MKADVSIILDRSEDSPVAPRQPEQFDLAPADQFEPDIVLGENWSLYCLDLANDRAIFVELPQGADLAMAPFAYAEQFQLAHRAAALPLTALSGLAARVAPPENLVLLMSTGRCGSTLVSRILSKIPGVWSLSEPDWPTNLALERFGVEHAKRAMLIAACTRLTCRPPNPLKTRVIVIKPRSEMVCQASAYVDVLQGARAVFLYRDCQGYVNSVHRFAQKVQGVANPPRGTREWEVVRHLATIGSPESLLESYFLPGEEIGAVDLMALGWVLRMDAYRKASGGGMHVTPIHYRDLNTDRAGQTRLLLKECGMAEDNLNAALQGFDKDAQANSIGAGTAQMEPLSGRQHERISELLNRWGWPAYQSERLNSLWSV